MTAPSNTPDALTTPWIQPGDPDALDVATDVTALPVTVEHDSGEAPYYILGFRDRPDALVPIVDAFNADDAMELALLPELRAATPYPEYVAVDGGPSQRDPTTESHWVAVVDSGALFLIGRASWPEHVELTTHELWATFSTQERHAIRVLGRRLRRDHLPRP